MCFLPSQLAERMQAERPAQPHPMAMFFLRQGFHQALLPHNPDQPHPIAMFTNPCPASPHGDVLLKAGREGAAGDLANLGAVGGQHLRKKKKQ